MLPRTTRGLRRLLMLAAIAGCRTELPPPVRTFSPGEHVARMQRVRAELLRVAHDPLRLDLRVRIDNDGASALELAIDGILLEHEGLEYPVVPRRGTPRIVNVDPGAARTLDLTIELQRSLERPARLTFRHLRRSDEWIQGLALPIPPAATPERDTDGP